MEVINQEVRFDIYCIKCKHKDVAEEKDPCDECLANPSNEHTEKPVKFEEDV